MRRSIKHRAVAIATGTVAAACAVAFTAFAGETGSTRPAPRAPATGGIAPSPLARGIGDIFVQETAPLPPEFADFIITFAESEGTEIELGRVDLQDAPGATLQAANSLTFQSIASFPSPRQTVLLEARADVVAWENIDGDRNLTFRADADSDGSGFVRLEKVLSILGDAVFDGVTIVFEDSVTAGSLTCDAPVFARRNVTAWGEMLFNEDVSFESPGSFPNQTVNAVTLTAHGDLSKSTGGDLTILSDNPAVTDGEVVVVSGALVVDAPGVTTKSGYYADGDLTVLADALLCDSSGDVGFEAGAGTLHLTGSMMLDAGSLHTLSAGTVVDVDGDFNGIADVLITDPCTLGGDLVVDELELQDTATFDGAAGDQSVITGPATIEGDVLKTTTGALRFFGSDVDLNGDVVVLDGNLEIDAATSLNVAGTLGAWLNLIVYDPLTLDGAGSQAIDSGLGNVLLGADSIKTTTGDLNLNAQEDVLLPQNLSVTDGHLVISSDDAFIGAGLIEVSNGDAIFDTHAMFNGPTTVDAGTVRLVREVEVGFGSVQVFTAVGRIAFEPASDVLIEFVDPYTFDQVIAGGELDIQGGALRVTIPEEPPSGMAYAIMIGGSRTGEFGTVSIEVGDPPEPSTRGFVTYGPDEVVLNFEDPDSVGACCLINGFCWVTTFTSCQSMVGTWQGANTSCAGVICAPPTAACCLPGDACLVVTIAECYGLGGEAMVPGTDCSACLPEIGACCPPSGVCEDGWTDAECVAVLGGVWQGAGTTCAADPCPPPPATGVCCRPDGSCTEGTAALCVTVGGTYLGDGTTCVGATCPVPPPSGACCYAGGTCGPASQAMCISVGGTWQGPGSSCAAGPCPEPTGACCLGPDCEVVPVISCVSMGGTFQGKGTGCAVCD
ncbi:MAG: hypothetical protein ACYTGP_07395 [Planctomycetota bacterium]|jgi:hypothetical protein